MKLKYILDIPSTLVFNFWMLPFKEAVRLPFYVSHKYKLKLPPFLKAKNIVVFGCKPKRFSVQFKETGSEDIIPNQYGLIKIGDDAKIYFEGKAKFAAGCSIRVDSGGYLEIGDNFNANRNCNLFCIEHIKFGNDCLLGFDISVRDSDGHFIYTSNGDNKKNRDAIIIGNHVWICANVRIQKGVIVLDDSVIAQNSLVTSKFGEKNIIIAGCPATILRRNITWKK